MCGLGGCWVIPDDSCSFPTGSGLSIQVSSHCLLFHRADKSNSIHIPDEKQQKTCVYVLVVVDKLPEGFTSREPPND